MINFLYYILIVETYWANDIQVLIERCDANIIAVTETWLNSDNEEFVSINGFKFISSCGLVDRGVGVSLFISNNISFKIVDSASLCIRVTSFEFLPVEIVRPKSTYYLCWCGLQTPKQ